MSSALFWVQQKVLTLVRRKYSLNRVMLELPIVKFLFPVGGTPCAMKVARTV